MNALIQDIRFALRAVFKRPLYMVVTVLVLALAIGANATVFSVFSGFFLQPLPYPDDDRLVMVHNAYPRMGLDDAGTSIPDYLDRRAEAPSLEDLAIFTGSRRALGADGTPESVQVMSVSPSLFDVLGVRPVLGRAFTEDEATPGNDSVAVLSHSVWQTRFGGRPDVLGTDVRLNGQAFRVVGVMPESFGFPSTEVRVYVPFAFTPAQMTDAQRGNEFSSSIGRLRPGATIEGLEAELHAIVTRNIERLGEAAAFMEQTGFTGRARSLRDYSVGNYRQMLLVLQVSVFAVLLIACANVANLQLARIMGRRKELTVRAVLGAQRRRLATLVLAESTLLAVLGAAAGLLLAYGGLSVVRTLGLDRASQGFEFALDTNVVLFTAGAAFVAATVSALAPIYVLLRERLVESINEAGRLGGGGRSTHAFRSALVTVQVALSVALLIGAGLLTKSFYQLQQQGPGFESAYVLTAHLQLPQGRYPAGEAQSRFYERALEELRALPGVTGAAVTNSLPFGLGNWTSSLQIDGYTPPEGTPQPHVQVRIVNEEFLPVLRVPVIEGRNFSAQETELVAVIDQNMARRYWPEGDAIGQRIRHGWFPEDEWHTIVGIVPPLKHGALTEDATKETVYWHYQQRPTSFSAFALRTTVPPDQLSRQLAATISGIDPDLAVFDVRTFEQRVSASLGPQRTPMVLTLVFAAVAFTLAIVGVYGVLTWAVTQRYGEIGVRIALGARRVDIVRLIVGHGGRLTLVGLALGVAGAALLGRALSAQIHGVSPYDPFVFGVVVAGLALSALFASWLPARRAGRIDPMAALRTE